MSPGTDRILNQVLKKLDADVYTVLLEMELMPFFGTVMCQMNGELEVWHECLRLECCRLANSLSGLFN